MDNKKTYMCEFCKTEYETIHERMMCEAKCFEKQKEEARKAAEAKKNAERESRKAEVDKAVKHANALLDSYIEVYGSYEYEDKTFNNRFRKLKYYGWF